MNLILFLLLVTAGEAAYFTYTFEQQTSDGFQKQTAEWQKEVNSLEMDSREMKDAKEQLQVRIDDAQAQVTALSGQAAKTQAPAASTTPAPTATPSATPADAVTPPPAVGSDLGNMTSLSGQTFVNCRLLKVEPDGVTFSHSAGITKVLFTDMSPAAQKRFGHDPDSQTAPAPEPMAQ
jgi:hypothetical protein